MYRLIVACRGDFFSMRKPLADARGFQAEVILTFSLRQANSSAEARVSSESATGYLPAREDGGRLAYSLPQLSSSIRVYSPDA
jgi:hypothetical protein